MSTNNSPHFIRTVGIRADSRDKITLAPTDLFGICKRARTGDIAGVDGVASDHVQSIFCRSCTPAPSSSQYWNDSRRWMEQTNMVYPESK